MTVHKALKIGDVDTAMAMLKADPDLIHSQDEHYYKTPLHIAADLGYVSITEWLLQHGADVNAKAYNDFSPLHLSESGTIARILIEHGADLDQVDSLGNTPLQKAAMRDKKEIIEAILETGYPMDLRSALMLGERERALELVKSNPIILTTQTEGWSLWGNTSPLGIAADQGDLEMVKIFLANGAPVNSTTYMPNRGNATPLTNAVWGGHIEVVKTLCANGADPDIASGGKFYRTVLDYAIVGSEPKMIWALIECGARPNEDLWEHIAERCSYIMREKRAILLGAGIATVSAIAVSVINRRRRKQVTYR